MKKIVLSVSDVLDQLYYLRSVIKQYKAEKVWWYNGIVGIENGGIPIADFLSSQLCLDQTNIKIQFRDARNKIRKRPLVKIENLPEPPFLLVDDIVDSGTTVKYFQDHTGLKLDKDFDLATLYWVKSTDQSDIRPTYFAATKLAAEWVVFPWERPVAFAEWWRLMCF
jgi:hypoxanthine phosphoribosyltransferase